MKDEKSNPYHWLLQPAFAQADIAVGLSKAAFETAFGTTFKKLHEDTKRMMEEVAADPILSAVEKPRVLPLWHLYRRAEVTQTLAESTDAELEELFASFEDREQQEAFRQWATSAKKHYRGGDAPLRSKPRPTGFHAAAEAAAFVDFMTDQARSVSIDGQTMEATSKSRFDRYHLIFTAQVAERTLEGMSDDDRQGFMRKLLDEMPTTRDEAFAVLYVVASLIQSPEGTVDISRRELLSFEGVVTGERGATRGVQESRDAAYQNAFRALSSWKIWGEREWRNPETKKKEMIRSRDPLALYTGPFWTAQKALPGLAQELPDGYTFVDSPLTKQLRKSNPIPFGDLTALARIPRGKVAGDWAASVGLAVLFYGRVKAHDDGDTFQVTRRTLLERFDPVNSPDELLKGKNPGRAIEYWHQAVGLLKEAGLIEGVEEPDETRGRGWASKWLDVKVAVKLSGIASEQAKGIRSAKERQTKARGGKSLKTVGKQVQKDT